MGAEYKSALTYTDTPELKRRPVSGTVGRWNAPVLAAILGTTQPFKPTIRADNPEIKEVLDRFDKSDNLRGSHVNLGAAHPLDNLKRTWANKRLSLPSKVVGSALSPMYDAYASALRGDHYNPFADSSTVYINEPGVLAHELGHAEDFNRSRFPGAYTLGRSLAPVMFYQEAKASNHAVNTMIDRAVDAGEFSEEEHEKIRRASRIMGGGFGSYVGSFLGLNPAGVIISAVAGQGAGSEGTLFASKDKRIKLMEAVDQLLEEKESEEGAEKDAYLKGFHKVGMPRGLRSIEQGPGAARIHNALELYEQARAMARPSDSELSARGYSRPRMEKSVGRILGASEGNKLNLSDAAPPEVPWWAIPASVAGGALVGGAGGKSRTGAAVGASLGGILSGAVKYRNHRMREDVRRTAGMLKDYGALDADTLRRILPLIR